MYKSALGSIATLLILLVCSSISFGQLDYEDNSDLILNDEFSNYTLGFTDLNGDYHDDLIFTPNNRDLSIYYQTGSDFNPFNQRLSSVISSTITTLSTGDLDKDGYDEILVSGFYTGSTICAYNGTSYALDTIHTEDVFAQGSNFVDINNDGSLDIFICHDDDDNLIYLNDKNGNLHYDISSLELPISSVTNSGNYGSEWIDFDDDGDLDLYIAKCRLGVTDTSDIRRRNALYVNNGQGIYKEMADEYGLASGWQSWVSQWGDVDNDGDLDALVLNHDFYHELFRNEDGVFKRDTAFANELLFDSALQALMQDFDNDGDLDVLVAGPENYMLWNDGSGFFLKDENPFGPNDARSAACGDFNSDGFIDFISSYSSNTTSRLKLATPNSNHFVKISFNGLESNREGIGSKVLLYGPWGIMRRDIKAGESYGIINSTNAHIGLGIYQEIDSLVVQWPSGIKDVFHINEVDKQYLLTESKCITPLEQIQVEGSTNLCEGESLTLRASGTAENIFWSNGLSGVSQIVVDTEGLYSYKKIDPNSDCLIQSDVVYVTYDGTSTPLELNSIDEPLVCGDGSVRLFISNFNEIEWSTGDTNSSFIDVSEEGWYWVDARNLDCSEWQRDSLYIHYSEASLPALTGDTIDDVGIVELSAQGDSIHWYETEWSTEVLSTDFNYSPYIEDSRSFFASNLEDYILPPLNLGEETHSGQTFYSSDGINAGMKFRALDQVTLKSVDLFTDLSGSRMITLLSEGEVMDSLMIQLEADQWTTVDLDFKLEAGVFYELSTDPDLNIESFGHAAPRLARSFDVPLAYPYILDGALSLTTSSYGAEYYYYFYNWVIEKAPVFCESERVEVKAEINELSVNLLDYYGIKIYPIPFSNYLTISNQKHPEFNQYKIKDLKGRILQSGIFSERLNVKNLVEGTYFLELYSPKSEVVLRKKINKIN